MAASNVVVLHGPRRATIRVTPTRTLSEVHVEACTKFGLNPQNFMLKRGQAIIDLTLQIRFTNLGPGAKLELVQARNTNDPIAIVLRVQEDGNPTQEFTATFTATDTLWGIVRKLETQNMVNLTERGSPSASLGSGRLLYDMPVVRVANREFSDFIEFQQTLGSLGIRGGRQLIVLRFKSSEIPFEIALEEITVFFPKEEEPVVEPEVGNTGGPSQSVEESKPEDIVMKDAPVASTESGGAEVRVPVGEGEVGVEQDGLEPTANTDKPVVAVFKPSESSTLAAAKINVPDKAYEVGIAEARLIQANIKKETIGKRLPSDKEIEEKQAAAIAETERVEKVVIKVRLPDGYISEQVFSKKHTAQDLYDAVRGTLRYPNEQFSLMIPPRETLPQAPKKLTTDLKLRTGATVHLVWGKGVSTMARKEPALTDEFIKTSRSLPQPQEPESSYEDAEGSESKATGKRKGGGDKISKENKLKNLLGFGKKR